MEIKNIQPKIDHSITIAIILFVLVLFTALQLTAQEKKENTSIDDNPNNEKPVQSATIPNAPQAIGDEIKFNNETGNAIITITDEGSNKGSITLPQMTSAPTTTTLNKLYNEGGTLKFNGSTLGSGGGGSSLWDDGIDAGAVVLSNPIKNLGIGTNGGTLLPKLHVKGDEGVLFQGTYNNGTALNFGSGTRFHFYPKRAAIRGGFVNGTQWDNSNVGSYSTSFGINTTASGTYSFATGNNANATSDAAFATGSQTIASGNWSTAMGANTDALGAASTALGNNTKAEAHSVTAIGRYNIGGGNQTSWVSTDPLFEIGIGVDDANRDNALTVLKNGNVGIGTSNPNYNLSIHSGAGTTAAQMMFQNDDTGNSGFRIGINSSEQADLILAQNKAMRFFTNNTLRMFVSGAGNIGIGTQTPSAKLDVNGSVKIGTNGTLITEIIELTGTTSGLSTDINFPNGFTASNTRILSCEVKDAIDRWYTIGYYSSSDEKSIYIRVEESNNNMTLHVPPSSFPSNSYRIVLMRIN